MLVFLHNFHDSLSLRPFQVALNGSYYCNCLRSQPRLIVSSMVVNDLAASVLVVGMGIVPALFECWPYGEKFCQIQVWQKMINSSKVASK